MADSCVGRLGSRGSGRAPAVFLVLLLAIVFAQPGAAQSQYIAGSVADPTGAVVPGASVKVTDVAKGSVARETVTDSMGRFVAINIQPGTFMITVEKTGFKTAEATVKLDINAKLDVGVITLAVGAMAEVVSISADATPLVTTNTMDKAYTVETTQMSELPMNGRNFTSLMNTVPGMTSAARSDFDVNFNDVSQYHSLGGRGSQNNFYLDGAPNIDVGDNQSQYTQASIDTIAEFRVLQSGFNAEYGRNSSVVVSVLTKSGGSQYHGAGYEYLRNNWFDAKCVICNNLQPQLRYNQFGGNIGGPLIIPKLSPWRDKRIFFFYNHEATRRNLPGSGYADIPDSRILSGDFSPWLLSTNMTYAPQFKNGTVFQPGSIKRDGAGNIIDGTPFPGNVVPQSMWQPMSANITKIYNRIPGYAGFSTVSPGYVRYYFNQPDKLDKDQDMARVDYAVSSKVNAFFRWVNDSQTESIDNAIWGSTPFPMQPQHRPKPGSSWSFNLVTTFTPNLVSETILTYNRQTQKLAITGTNPLDRDALGVAWPQLYPATNITNSLPDVNTGVGGFSWGLGDPGWHNWGKDYSITENLTWTKGRHTVKAGVFLNRDDKAQTGTWAMQGEIDFYSGASMPLDTGNGLANLMLGNFNRFTQPSGAVFPYFRFLEADSYIQDNWKVTKRLTLDVGLRVPYMVPTYTVIRNGTPGGEGNWHLYSVDLRKYDPAQRAAINPSTGYLVGNPLAALSPLGLVCDPCAGTPQGFSPAKVFFEPRIGLAYDLFGNGSTALRGGFGMFHERLRQNNFNFGAGGQWPNLSAGSVYNGNVATIDPTVVAGADAAIQPPGLTVWPADNTMPTIYSWYGGIQRQLPAKFVLDVSYSGNRAVHLMDQRQVNALPAGYLISNPNALASVGGWANSLLPYTGWGSLNAIETLAYSRYNAMMIRFSRRFSNNFSANVNYTLSQVKGVAANDSDNINNPFNIHQDYGLASYDQRHVFTLDFIYMFPRTTSGNMLKRQLVNGWEWSGIFRAQSGMPLTVNANGSLYGVNIGSNGGQYTNLIGDPYANTNSFQVLNPLAFQRPADGSWGTTTRNQFRMPSLWNFDTAVMKNFFITESVKFTLRTEVFNLFNHPQVFGVNTGFSGDNPLSGISTSNTTFGQANSWRDARTFQVVARFSF